MKDLRYPIGIVVILATLTLVSFRPTSHASVTAYKKPGRSLKRNLWQSNLVKKLKKIEEQHAGNLGLYIKDLNTGEEFELRAQENWYLASTVKVPMAMAVLKLVDEKKLTLNTKVKILPEDYVDGNGPLKNMPSGTSVSIRYLIEQMIIWSDNMASDMLLRVAGLENVNQLITSLTGTGISEVTTLKDVRRQIYREIHPKALELTGTGMLELRQIDDPVAKINKLASLLKIPQMEFKEKSLEEAYESYYQKGLNSGSPKSYSRILEALWGGDTLKPESREFLLQTMLKTQTGKGRIRAGLTSPWVFAHKTGTQYQRIGDVGYIWNAEDPKRKPIIVVSFVRGVTNRGDSDRILEEVARAISTSGVL